MNESSVSLSGRTLRNRFFVRTVLWLVTTGIAFLLGAYAYKHRDYLMSFLEQAGDVEIATTSLYRLEIDKIRSPATGRDGGIAALENGVLLSNGRGVLWFVDAEKVVMPLALRIPINRDTFDADPDNADVPFKDRFSVKDILVAEFNDQLTLVASHSQWDEINNCYSLRVSATSTTYAVLEGREDNTSFNWKTLFESSPCLSLSSISGSTNRRPTIAAGGRLIRRSESEILVTVGDFGAYKRGRASYPQELDNSYGKTIVVDLETGSSRIFTSGHRNPQGLVMTSDSKIWSTEHGPEGGDELNVILEGKNYGFPFVTYGTDYGTSNWPLSDQQGAHNSFEKPIFAWVPSIATSQLIAIQGNLFSLWEGDLIISSLAGRSLFRIRLESERVLMVEPFEIGHRIRDIIEMSDGRLLLKTDDSHLIYIQPVDASKFDDYEPWVRGKFLVTQCQGCHTFNRGGASGIGPNLYQIVGRQIAGGSDFTYSTALKAVGGRWTANELEKFLENPNLFAPGTEMQVNSSFTKEQISSLVAYLETLQ